MQILLDTNVLLWATMRPKRLDGIVARTLLDRANLIYFSAVNIWEIAIKSSLGREDFVVDPRAVARMAVENGFVGLPISVELVQLVADLPPHHRDPFDRLLLAQAFAGPMHLYTSDAALTVYSDLVHLIR